MKKNLILLVLGGLVATLLAHAAGPVAVRPALPVAVHPAVHPDIVTAQGTLSVDETGPADQTYQWKINGVDIPGANGPTLTGVNVYSVVISTPTSSIETSGTFDYNVVYTRSP